MNTETTRAKTGPKPRFTKRVQIMFPVEHEVREKLRGIEGINQLFDQWAASILNEKKL